MRLVAPVLGLTVWLTACLTPTEIDVVITSRDVACASGDLVFGDLAVYTSPKDAELLGGPAEGTSGQCATKSERVDLGDIVLTPRGSNRKASLLVVAGVKLPHATTPQEATAEQCASEYASFLAAGAPADYCKDPAHTCGACIVARRSLGFIDHTKLSLGVELTARCQGVFCQVGQTCGNDGACVSAETTCVSGKCELGSGGGGGGGGGAGGTGGMGAGGGGGAGGSCTDIGGGLMPMFSAVPQQTPGGLGITTDGLGNAWVALTNQVQKCTTTSCTTDHSLATTGLAYKGISADGTTVAAWTSAGIDYQVNGQSWASFVPTALCTFQDGGLLSARAVGGKVRYAALDKVFNPSTGIYTSEINAVACDKEIELIGTPPGVVWAFPNGSVWLAANDKLYRAIPAALPDGTGPTGVVSGIWGYNPDPSTEIVLTCSPLGVYRRELQGVPIVSSVLTPGAPCIALSGYRRCDGTADVWTLGVDHNVRGYHFDPKGDPTSFTEKTSLSAATANAVGIAVDSSSIWLAGPVGVLRSPRPLLP